MITNCKKCGKVCNVKPSDINDIHNYHCKECRPEYMAEKRKNGEIRSDWSALKRLNAAAMSHGHESIFKARRNGIR